jgi:LPXTG-site transpeptidase (sortase) family protein
MRDREQTERQRLSVRLLLVSVTSAVAIATAAGIANLSDRDQLSTPVPNMTGEVATVEGTPAPLGPAPSSAAIEPHSSGTLGSARPTRLRIPKLGVDTTLVDLALQPDGTLEVPLGGFPAGWFTGAPTPGELGPAIIAGHVDWDGRPGVFADLDQMRTGDVIRVDRQDGSVAYFRVTSVLQIAKSAFPTADVYGDLDHAGLRLITCGGDFDTARRSYVDNVIVFAEFVGAGATGAETQS